MEFIKIALIVAVIASVVSVISFFVMAGSGVRHNGAIVTIMVLSIVSTIVLGIILWWQAVLVFSIFAAIIWLIKRFS